MRKIPKQQHIKGNRKGHPADCRLHSPPGDQIIIITNAVVAPREPSSLLGCAISLSVDIRHWKNLYSKQSSSHHITIVQSIWWQMPNSSRENINWWKVRWSDNSHYCHRRILKLTITQKCDFNDGWCNVAMGCETERGPSKRFSALKFQCFSGFVGNVTIQ